MNKETRIQKIQEIIDKHKNNPYGIKEIPWEEGDGPQKLVSMPVYKIPLKYLVYNKYNGRILSRTKSLESQKHCIDVESKEGKALIEKLLWDSKPERNKKTLKSIKRLGQEKVGIITKDGIIIDGNRRVMLLNKIDNSSLFKAVVLPVTVDEDPIGIEKLETSYQMGEDKKLDYNPIEVYLKTQNLYKTLNGSEYDENNENEDTIEKIYNWMGDYKSDEEKKGVIFRLQVMQVMDDYLDYLGYNGIYTQLDGREEQFRELTRWLNLFYGEGSGKAFDGYKDSDVDDLKIITYDYIRTKYKNEELRKIARGQKENHFFGNNQSWKSFCDFHFEHVKDIKNEEEKIDYDSENLAEHLNGRDTKYTRKVKDFLNENVENNYQQIRNAQAKNQPEKLAKEAFQKLVAIDQKHKAFTENQAQKQIEMINQLTTDMLNDKSPKRLLSQVIYLLESVKLDSSESKEELLKKVAQINKISFEMKKKLGG